MNEKFFLKVFQNTFQLCEDVKVSFDSDAVVITNPAPVDEDH